MSDLTDVLQILQTVFAGIALIFGLITLIISIIYCIPVVNKYLKTEIHYNTKQHIQKFILKDYQTKKYLLLKKSELLFTNIENNKKSKFKVGLYNISNDNNQINLINTNYYSKGSKCTSINTYITKLDQIKNYLDIDIQNFNVFISTDDKYIIINY